MDTHKPFSDIEKLCLVKKRKTKFRPATRDKIFYLPEDQKDQLHRWFKEPINYAEMSRRCREQFGMEIGKNTIGKYYRKFVAMDLLESRAKAMGISAELNKWITKCPAHFNRSICDLVGRKAFELLKENEEVNPKTVKIYLDLYYRMVEQDFKDRVLKVKERTIKLKEQQQAKAIREAKLPQLTPKQRAERLQDIMHVLPDSRLPTDEQIRKILEHPDQTQSLAS